MSHTFRTIFSWVLSLAVLVLVGFWLFFLYKSYINKAQIESIKNEIVQAEGRDSYLYSIKNVLRGTEGDIETIEKRFIKEDEVPAFIDLIEREAAAKNVSAELTGITIDSPKGESFRMLRVRILSRGSWSDIVSFVHRVDTMSYALTIDRANFTKLDSDWSTTLEISQAIK